MLCCVGVLSNTMGATVFSDAFNDTNQSKINWVNYAGLLSITYSGGAITLKNPDTVFTGFLVHSIPAKPTKFTLSATITTTTAVNGAGLMFCLNSTSGLKGYTLQIGTGQNVFAYKYAAGATIVSPSKTSSYVNATANVLTVSKSSDTFNIFVNGHYVTRFYDAAFQNGDIAIMVPPKSTIKVDDVILTDQFLVDNTPTCFSDSFKVTDLEGWNTTPIVGEYTVGAGKLILNNTDNNFSSIVYTDGNFQSASMKTTVRHTRGAGMYGLCYVSVVFGDSGKVNYKPYAFLVDSLRRYSIVYPESANVRTRSAQSFIYGSLGTDTLEVIRFATHFVFKVNGIDVGETIPAPQTYRIAGAGLYVAKQTAATFNYFLVGGDSTGASCVGNSPVRQKNFTYVKPYVQVFSAGSVVYNAMGRKIGVFDRYSFERADLVNGLYFVLPGGVKCANVKAMRVMKVKK
jgi:hypothetical protein